MVIPLFTYKQNLNFTTHQYSGMKENGTMFKEDIHVHKNMNNPIYVTISDRDRVRLKVDEETGVDFQLKLRIIDSRKAVVQTDYLIPYADGNYFQTLIRKELLDELEEDEVYTYVMTMVHPESGTETPLYTDHNFSVKGNMVVHGNFYDTFEETYTGVENYIYRMDYKDHATPNKFFFVDTIMHTDDLLSLQLKSHNAKSHCLLTLEKNLQNHYPMTQRREQWEEVMTINDPINQKIPIDLIPSRVQMRVVIHTNDPDNFYLVSERLAK